MQTRPDHQMNKHAASRKKKSPDTHTASRATSHTGMSADTKAATKRRENGRRRATQAPWPSFTSVLTWAAHLPPTHPLYFRIPGAPLHPRLKIEDADATSKMLFTRADAPEHQNACVHGPLRGGSGARTAKRRAPESLRSIAWQNRVQASYQSFSG